MIKFKQIAVAPACHWEDGRIGNHVFALDEDGRIWACDTSNDWIMLDGPSDPEGEPGP